MWSVSSESPNSSIYIPYSPFWKLSESLPHYSHPPPCTWQLHNATFSSPCTLEDLLALLPLVATLLFPSWSLTHSCAWELTIYWWLSLMNIVHILFLFYILPEILIRDSLWIFSFLVTSPQHPQWIPLLPTFEYTRVLSCQSFTVTTCLSRGLLTIPVASKH